MKALKILFADDDLKYSMLLKRENCSGTISAHKA